MYLGNFGQWLADAVGSVGDAIKHVFYQITHDPYWGGATLALLAVIVLLFVLKKKAAG